jgi:hypothetical protein
MLSFVTFPLCTESKADVMDVFHVEIAEHTPFAQSCGVGGGFDFPHPAASATREARSAARPNVVMWDGRLDTRQRLLKAARP